MKKRSAFWIFSGDTWKRFNSRLLSVWHGVTLRGDDLFFTCRAPILWIRGRLKGFACARRLSLDDPPIRAQMLTRVCVRFWLQVLKRSPQAGAKISLSGVSLERCSPTFHRQSCCKWNLQDHKCQETWSASIPSHDDRHVHQHLFLLWAFVVFAISVSDDSFSRCCVSHNNTFPQITACMSFCLNCCCLLNLVICFLYRRLLFLYFVEQLFLTITSVFSISPDASRPCYCCTVHYRCIQSAHNRIIHQ